MDVSTLRRLYLDFFIQKYQHAEIVSSPLLPENDPTCLFNSAGMQPMVPYLLGAEHPAGKRLVNSQICLRTGDIDEVGDDTHHTFFEMLGNWSLGDYFKQEAIAWSYEFLTGKKEDGCLELDPQRICVTVFEGDKQVPLDQEAIDIWKSLGFKLNSESKPGDLKRVYPYSAEHNWWKLAETGPCGPDTEIFYYKGDLKDPKFINNEYAPNDESDIYVEIWNNVFMSYYREQDGSLRELENRNIDTGMGFERLLSFVNGVQSAYETPLFKPVLEKLRGLSSEKDIEASIRIIADHLRAAVFILGDVYGVTPSNTDQGYVLRRLIRRAARHMHKIQVEYSHCLDIAEEFIRMYKDHYGFLQDKKELILSELKQEIEQFALTLEKGYKEFMKIKQQLSQENCKHISGELAFRLYDTFGFPLEMTMELALEHDLQVDEDGFAQAFEKHQNLSRQASAGKFKGGLADSSEQSTKLHTATHLLHQALRNVLGDQVGQKGSNITPERLRFDFNHPEAVTKEQLAEVENIVNAEIAKNQRISYETMSVEQAKAQGAIGLFEDKYADEINVYKIGDFSLEICGGPHVESTAVLGRFKIKKEQSCGKGIRRIKAVLEG